MHFLDLFSEADKFLLVLSAVIVIISLWTVLCFALAAKQRCKDCPCFKACEGLPTVDSELFAAEKRFIERTAKKL